MIKNLTPRLSEAGKIKIGAKGEKKMSTNGKEFQQPVKLDHFILTTMERDADNNYVVDLALMEKIKASGNCLVNQNGDLVGIPIRFLYNDTDLNFYTKYASYTGKHLSCHGDGEFATKRITDFKKKTPCPCPRLDRDYDGKDKCKFSGVLTCIIDDAGLFGQVHKFRTTSENTVKGILGGMALIENITRKNIAGVPLMLTLTPKTTTTPGGATVTIYVVSICYRGNAVALRQETLTAQTEEKQYMIAMDSIEAEARPSITAIESDEEAIDIAEEFFPDRDGDIKEVKEVVPSSEVDKIDEDETGHFSQEEIDQAKDQAKEDVEEEDNTIMGEAPVGDYLKVYNNLLAEKDITKALPMTKRLQKNNLLYWIATNYPDVEVDPSLKKPELLKIAEGILETVLGKKEEIQEEIQEKKEIEKEEVTPGPTVNPGTDRTETKPETKSEVKPEPEDKIKTADKPPREWDNSGFVSKDLLRQIIPVKEKLEAAGVLKRDPIVWAKCVNYFLDADKNPVSKATLLTQTQGENFLAMLTSELIPF